MKFYSRIKKITHEHKVSLGILLASGILDLSFSAEKLAIHFKYKITPLTWAIVFGTLGLVTLTGAVVEFFLDVETDCCEETLV